MNSYITENYVKDKVIVITGASSGFGKETAKKAAELGGKVVLAARRDNLLKEIVEEIYANGGEASYIKTDIRDQDQARAMINFAIATYGRVDVLVNNAGTMPLSYFSEHAIAMEAWEQSIATAINGTLYCISAVYDQMIKQGKGHIVNVSSIFGNTACCGGGVYNVTKAAVRMLGDSLRIEARGKIKVTNIKPTSVAATGLVATEVDYNAGLNGVYSKIINAFSQLGTPDLDNPESMNCFDYGPSILADNIIYTINQPWGVDISEITVRATNETMFV